jgi:hypothetical protein
MTEPAKGTPNVDLVSDAKTVITKLRQWVREMKKLGQDEAKATRNLLYRQTGKFGKLLKEIEPKVSDLNAEFDEKGK